MCGAQNVLGLNCGLTTRNGFGGLDRTEGDGTRIRRTTEEPEPKPESNGNRTGTETELGPTLTPELDRIDGITGSDADRTGSGLRLGRTKRMQIERIG